jgi:uncharacterized protein (DUF2132 family)
MVGPMAADPLHGVTLEQIVTELVAAYGFEELAVRIPIHCFESNPSVASSLKFLRRTPWARAKVESFYLFHLREQRRRSLRTHGQDLRAAAGLVVGATQGVVGVVQNMHNAIGAFPVITDLVYAAVRGVTGVVGASIDAAVQGIAPVLGEGAAGPEREAVLAALNGVVGDHLARQENPLAIQMSLRPPLAGLHTGGTLLVLVHGSCMNDLQWTAGGHDHGQALAGDLGFTPAYLHYNSGRHISENGAEFAALLAAESEPFSDILLVAHSMGGLVSRAAIHAADTTGAAWRHKLRALVTLGTPHHGAPLERGGNVLERILGATRYSAPLRALGEIRSAGVTDLRFGNVVDADWKDRDRFAHGADPRTPTPLPDGVRSFAIAATPAKHPPAPLDERALPGDGLVPVPSALGQHEDPAFALRFTDTFIAWGTNHLGLIASRTVYEQVRAWLTPLQREAP